MGHNDVSYLPKVSENNMVKRLTPDEVLARCRRVHEDKYEYDLATFVSTSKPMRVICRTHGEFLQTPSNHFGGKGCPVCSGVPRYTSESFIAQARCVHPNLYQYDKTVYVKSTEKIIITCPEHGDFLQIPAQHLAGSGCPSCGGTKRLTQTEFLSRASAVHGASYDLSKVSYLNNSTPVEIVCPTHGSFFPTPSNFLSGKGCSRCAGNMKLSTEQFIEKAMAVHGGYSYEHTVYQGAKVKVAITCPDHGIFLQVANTHLNGSGCPYCKKDLAAKRLAKSQDDFMAECIDTHGDRYDYRYTIYVDDREKIVVGCKDHGYFQQQAGKHIAGQGCPSCSHSGPSSGQLEVYEFISGYTPAVLEHTIPGTSYRIDIFLPELNIGIEYNGLIWHSSKMLDNPLKDAERYTAAQDTGIRLLTVFEDEWLHKKEAVKRTLMSAIGCLPRVYARDTELVEITNEAASIFYGDHHMIGPRARSAVNLGLSYRGALVACMSFDTLRSIRGSSSPRHMELVRYASSLTVVGGASKLFKYFLSLDLVDRVTSYSDNRLFSGRMYEKLGFQWVHDVRPDYWYTTGRPTFGRKHKAGFQKTKLVKMFPGCDLSKSEREICYEAGLYRIYDCGKKRWDYYVHAKVSE